ncbi:carboxypeptidase regulatory-like domain-containing protein [Baaleninema sp.]|uniref:carboxypeptidase regulatory-like domain-containing protein n=1 Tax=Baaleninema sp. TaxID=3101197 RepID=UPI003D030D41
MRWPPITALLGLTLFGAVEPALAHGANIVYRSQRAIELQATYDSGEPMAEAQVTVYAPDNPSLAWKTGTTDDRGEFVFVPEEDQTGRWTVSVRQAGHGDIVHINLDNTEATETAAETDNNTAWVAEAGETTLSQRIVTVAAVIWGCIGTALYFSRHKS